jgi:hypothetical protein
MSMKESAENPMGALSGSHVDKNRVAFVSPRDPSIPIIKQPPIPVVNEKALLDKEKAIKDYNNKIHELDPLYAELTPFNGYIVRCFHLETNRSKGGIIMEPSVKVRVPTQNGIGTLEMRDSPYKYQRKAVIVAIPDDHQTKKEDNKLVPGVTIMLEDSPILPSYRSKEEAIPVLQNGFVHCDSEDINPPTSITDRHFGYLKIRLNDISAILPNNKNKEENGDS